MNINKSDIELLKHLASSKEASYSKKIAIETGLSTGAASQELRKLCKMDLIKREQKGKEIYYSVQIDKPVIKYFKIFSTLLMLNELIILLKEKSKKIILFGSAAKGEDTAQSDIDIFILTDNKDDVKKIIYEERNKFPKKLSPIIVDSQESLMLKNKDIALKRKIEEGITIWSKKDEY